MGLGAMSCMLLQASGTALAVPASDQFVIS
jgi:hypothetical protein